MTEPLRLTFDVACRVEHAFTVWTSGIGTWWPHDHTVTGHRDLAVVLQGSVGGRIYERTPEGVEHDWGEVTVWQPPSQLAYRWHLGGDSAAATDVDIRFLPHGESGTRVEIEHRGWERLGDTADTWRDRNAIGWQSLLPHFIGAMDSSPVQPAVHTNGDGR